jgi:GTP-binding protein Era
MHKSGFVNIIGNPNVGKSTLMNALVGERMSIITSKPQTTRHRILGILSSDEFQVVFSDTPGMIKRPAYQMQAAMNQYIRQTYEDADLILMITDLFESEKMIEPLIKEIRELEVPRFAVINKIDMEREDSGIEGKMKFLESQHIFQKIFTISALKKTGVQKLLEAILDELPEGPEYFPKDQLTDRPERFFVSEIIREKILIQYKEEVPYSCEVVIESFKEEQGRKGPFVRIEALIYVNRKTQKSIIIGKGGTAIKSVGIKARKDIEKFLDRHVHLQLYVKVKENWRDNEKFLRYFGYR